MGNDVVRIDSELLNEIESLLCKEKSRSCRLSCAQFVNMAVRDFIKKIKSKGGKLILELK